MARVPRHFRDKLVSSQTGVNTLDTSGADTARAVTQMADQFLQVSGGLLRQQKAATERSEVASKKAEYVNKSAVAAQKIQKDFAENPTEGFEMLTRKNQEIKEDILSGVSDGRLQNEIGAAIDGVRAQQSISNKKWEIGRESAMEQQFLVDVQRMNIDTIMQGATAEEYQIMLEDDTFTEENYKRAWSLNPEEGAKNYRTALNGMFRARAMSLMDQGRLFDAQDFIEKSEEPDEETRREVKQNFIKMQTGAKAKRLFETISAASIDVVETQEGMLADQMTPSDLDERVLAVSAQAAATPDPDQQRVLIQYAQVLADIRDMKLENILLRAPGDTNVESGLQAKYEALIIRNNGDATASPDVYLSDFLEFQNEIVREANAGNVSAKSYNKWMFWSKVALEGFDPKAGWFDNNVAREKGVRKKLKVFLNDHSDKSSEWKIDAMREVYESLPAESLEMIGDDVAESLFKRGKAVATLKQLGFPVDIIDSKVVRTSAGNFNVVDFDQEGMPVLNVTTQNMER